MASSPALAITRSRISAISRRPRKPSPKLVMPDRRLFQPRGRKLGASGPLVWGAPRGPEQLIEAPMQYLSTINVSAARVTARIFRRSPWRIGGAIVARDSAASCVFGRDHDAIANETRDHASPDAAAVGHRSRNSYFATVSAADTWLDASGLGTRRRGCFCHNTDQLPRCQARCVLRARLRLPRTVPSLNPAPAKSHDCEDFPARHKSC